MTSVRFVVLVNTDFHINTLVDTDFCVIRMNQDTEERDMEVGGGEAPWS